MVNNFSYFGGMYLQLGGMERRYPRRGGRPSLKAPTPDDITDLHTLYADPRTWWNISGFPYTSFDQTRHRLDAWRADWRYEAIGYWIARDPSGKLIGVGGLRRTGAAWNLRFYVMPGQWHLGYATYMARSAMRAARYFDRDAPVFMNLLARNHTACLIANHLRFLNVHNDFDAATTDSAPRRIYADRPVSKKEIADYLAGDITL